MSVLAAALVCLAHPQQPADELATYLLRGKPAVVTRTDVALEMAFHLRRRERGQQAAEHLVAAVLTRQIAVQKNLLPADKEVRAFWGELQDQLRAAGRRPEDVAAVRNTGEAQWLADLAVQMAQERIVRAELGLSAKETVTGDMLQLWLQEAKAKANVVTDADQLPAGTAVRVGGADVPLIDLGMLLLRTAEDDERDKFVRQVAWLTTLEALARDEGLQLTAEDLDASVQRRRDDAARDPRFRGITFENMLQTQGLTVTTLRELRTFRAQILLDKLAAARFPIEALAAELAADRRAVSDRVGARRRIGLIFVRASDEPNGLIPRTFAEALQHLEGVRERLGKETWENVARIESEHASSKMQGGDAGWHRRVSDRLPEPMLAAAWALPAGDVSMPLRNEEGCFLVKVLEVEPEPADAVLLSRLREWKAQDLSQRLLTDAKIEFVGGAKK